MFVHKETETIESKDVMSKSEDLISDLPRDIIETILELLPLKDVVKTSILSKRWRNNWTTVTRLDFDYNFLKSIKNNGSLQKIGFENIINSVFHLYKGQALNSALVLPPEIFYADCRDFDKWMLLLLKKGLQKLILYNFDPFDSLINKHPIKLSSHLFSCKDLRVLHLCNFVLEPQPPRAFICFKNLIVIHFESVEIAKDVFETILSSALQLQTLVVSNCKGLDHLNIHAPSLRKMHVGGDYKTIRISNMPHLEDVSFGFSYIDKFSCCGLSIESWPQLKGINFGFDSFQFFASGMSTKLLPTKFCHLNRLELHDVNFRAPSQFFYVVCLIKRSPILQNLDISFPSYEEGVIEPITMFMEVHDWGDCSLDRLQKVNMRSIKYVSPELLLLKQLLRLSPVLQKLYVHPSSSVVKDEVVEFEAALEQFERASPRAMVIHKPRRTFSA